MTRAQLIRGVFRMLALKLGKLNIPFLLTNHVSDVIGGGNPKKPGMPAKKKMCLVDGTEIRTKIGNSKIENVAVNDIIPTVSGTEVVDETFTFTSDDVFEIQFEDGNVVRCTGNHKFMNDNLEWCCVRDLINDDEIMAVQD